VIAAVYLPFTHTRSSSTSTSSHTTSSTTSTSSSSSIESSQSVPSFLITNSTASSVNSTLGLSLQLFVSPSNGSLGQLVISAEVVNIRNVSNNVTAENDWHYSSDSLNPYGPCGSPAEVAFGIFQGYYNLNNFSNAIALVLYNPNLTYSCTTYALPPSGGYYSFSPQSDLANIADSKGRYLYNKSISLSDLIGGYWSGNSSAFYRSFLPNTYTIIACDQWGQLVLLHFAVTSSSSITQQTTTTTFYSTATSNTSESRLRCTSVYPNGITPPDVPVIFAQRNSTVYLCVRFYYYNSTATETFNTASLFGVGLVETTPNETAYPPALDFNVTVIPNEVTLGGPSNLNEGEYGIYAISTGDTSNGTYATYFPAWLYPSLEDCSIFTSFIVRNPNPSYGLNGSCTAPLSNFYNLNSYGFVNGFLTIEVVGLSNSTTG
jgi:hypothetical protein